MRVLDSELKNKSIDYNELLKYGFINIDGIYTYKNKICNEQFEMIVIIKDNKITSKLIDLANEDEYILVDIKDTIGEFVGKVREEYENELQNIIAKCTSRRPSGLRKTTMGTNSLAHRTTWLRSDFQQLM